MRKSKPIKFGLNVRKPVSGSATPAKPGAASVFAEAPDGPKEEPSSGPLFQGGSQARESAKLASELESENPSVFAYDEVYSSSMSRARAKQGQKTGDLKPRYMDKLMAAAEVRKTQSEVVKERLLVKEREREGDEFADKGTFVTASYRELKDRRQKMAEDEEARERKEDEEGRQKKKGQLGTVAAGFYRNYLDQIDREDASNVAAADTDGVPSNREEEPRPLRTELASGLNVLSRSARRQHGLRPPASPTDRGAKSHGPPANVPPSSRPHTGSRGYSGPSADMEMDRVEREKLAAKEAQKQALIARYARRNTTADIEAARRRYLARKQAAA
ncbi:hypothetical protein GGF46_003295 [Coemansia sp. RSA 552]|nr:hypothetical protein GGF46_003295 [Coemansia sp. RSA 552]